MAIPAIGKKQGVGIMDALFAEARKLAATPEERAEAGAYLRILLAERKKKRSDVDVKGMLGNCADMINLSYIAKQYFNRDRTWLYQRINGAIVNGKPAAFTQQELKVLADALHEISLTISDTSNSFIQIL